MAGELVHIEKLYNERLWVLRATSMDADSVDAWEAAVRLYISTANSTEQYVVYDMLNIPNFGFTTYMRQRVRSILTDYPDAWGRLAIVIPLNPLSRHVFEAFIRFTGHRLQPNLDVRLFDNLAKGIAWAAAELPSEAVAD